MSEISKAGMAAILILQELENVGISATLRYRPDVAGITHGPTWIISATLQKLHHAQALFSEKEVLAEGDWIGFAARTVQWIQGMLRQKATAPRMDEEPLKAEKFDPYKRSKNVPGGRS
jgi:hypothetical protein